MSRSTDALSDITDCSLFHPTMTQRIAHGLALSLRRRLDHMQLHLIRAFAARIIQSSLRFCTLGVGQAATASSTCLGFSSSRFSCCSLFWSRHGLRQPATGTLSSGATLHQLLPWLLLEKRTRQQKPTLCGLRQKTCPPFLYGAVTKQPIHFYQYRDLSATEKKSACFRQRCQWAWQQLHHQDA